jgi:hypothetical protein
LAGTLGTRTGSGGSRWSVFWRSSARRRTPYSLSEDFRTQHPSVPWRDIIGLRVVLAHHYHRVDPNQVWVIAATEVPRLVQDIRPAG